MKRIPLERYDYLYILLLIIQTMRWASQFLRTIFIGFACTTFISATESVKSSDSRSPLTLETIIDDMRLPHEARPHGVPLSYGWTIAPRRGQFHNPERYRAIAAWGQVYKAAQGSLSQNTRVQIRDIRAYRLSRKEGRWYLVQRSRKVEGAAFREDFKNNFNRPANVRNEPDGGISVHLTDGFNYHFWALPGRAEIDPAENAGVLVAVDARLIVEDLRKPDDRNSARYILSVGADYWTTLTAPWDNFKTNADIGIGRFRYIRSKWQTFTMTSLSETELWRSTPPL